MTGEQTRLLRHPVENLDFDRLLEEKLGEFGRYQKLIYFLVCLPACLSGAVTMASVFTIYQPEHRCLITECDSPVIPHFNDAFMLGYSNYSIPKMANGKWDQCHRYTAIHENGTCLADNFSANITTCDSYLYNTDEMKTTLVTKFNLVCDEDRKIPMVKSVFFWGVLVGAFLYGIIGDYLGRKEAFFIGLLQQTGFGIACAFAESYKAFSILYFFMAVGQVGVFQTAFVIGVEFVGKSKREFCGIAIEYFFVIGELGLALGAYLLRDWMYVQLLVTVPGLIFFAYYFILPQPVRFLIQKQKFSDAQEEIAQVAKWNGVEVPTQQELALYQKEEEEGPAAKETLLDFFKHPRLCLRLLNVFYCWMVVTMVYFGLSLNSSDLVGNTFLNFALMAVAEFPGYTIAYFSLVYVGRKKTMCASLLVSGAACLIAGLLTGRGSTMQKVQTAFALIGKFGVTSAFGTIYLYTSELFPTGVRNACIGTSSMIGRFGSIVSPYVAELYVMTGLPWLPMVVFAGAALVSGMLMLLLPETKGAALPKTMEEAENISRQAPEPVNASVQ